MREVRTPVAAGGKDGNPLCADAWMGWQEVVQSPSLQAFKEHSDVLRDTAESCW